MTSRGGVEDNTRDRHGFDLSRVLQRLAVTAAHASGFGDVTVNVRTSEGEYAVVADTDGELLGTRTTEGFWAALIRGGRQMGNSYIVPPEHVRLILEAYPEVRSVAPDLPTASSPDDWDRDHMLVVPMRSSGAKSIGYFSVDCPVDGKVPGPELVADMETFAEHAALTVQLARETEAVRGSEERFRSLVQNATDVIAVLDSSGITRYVSPSVERVLGYTPEARIGSSVLDAGLVHPEDEARVRAAIAEVAARPGAELSIPFRLRHRDGSWRHLEGVVRNLLGDPSVGGIVVNYRDVTERKRAEARAAALSSLGHRLSSASDAVDATQIIAEVADDLIGWDAFTLLLYSREEDLLSPVLDFDLVDGKRTMFGSGNAPVRPGPISRRTMEEGPQLLLREQPSLDLEGSHPFGDTSRPSASLIFVPIHGPAGVAGVLSTQSYTPMAYTESDVETLQALAGHCGGALERIRAEEALHRAGRDYRNLFELANDAIVLLEPETEVVLNVNERACALYDIPRDRLIGRSIKEFSQDVGRGEEHIRRLLDEGRYEEFETVQYRADGTPINLLINASVIEFRGQRAVLSINRDVTERRALEEQLRHRAFHDSLTGLPNRALFLDRLGHALERTERRPQVIGVLYIDVDRLKRINDSLGHEAGDALLVAIGKRLRAAVRPEDTVARLSGDEFAVLLEELRGAEEATPIAERILGALAAPFAIEGHEVSATASIGIAVDGSADTTPAALLQAADVAMYQAKGGGGARYAVYGAEMAARALGRLGLETELRRAVEHGEFEVHYQPEVELATGRIAEVEALVRWRHPEHGMLLPSEWLGLAEETGLIVPIGRWVLGQACRQVREWQDRYPSDPPLRASVNLSGTEFGRPEIVGVVDRILRESGLNAGDLELEITESVVMANEENIASTLRKFDARGILLAIDDFGTGYSSLSHLKRFPISTLKIDREFVRGLDRDPGDTAIVRAVLGLGHAMGMRVVAEGAETAEQLAALRVAGCELGQGYYLSRPLPAAELGALLSGGAPVSVWARDGVARDPT